MTFSKRAMSALGRRTAFSVSLATGLLAAIIGTAEASKPEPWQLGFQPFVSPAGQQLDAFHDLLLWVITLISIFVLGLLAYVCVRFKASNNPNPSRTTHNTLIEVLWTAIPVLILVVLAVPSFKLLYVIDRTPNPDMTIKVTANQWYWTYEYPDQEVVFDSNMIAEDELQPGQTRLLEVDNRLVVPTGSKIQVLVTSNDVMHSFFVPSAAIQTYGIGGRMNEAWMQFDKEGVYYGQCNQICGTNHAFMPIVVEAVSPEAYGEWLKKAKVDFASNETSPALRLAANGAVTTQ